MTTKKWVKFALGISLAALFLWLALRQSDLGKVARTLAGVNLIYLVAGLIAIALDYSCRVERWRLMLISANPNLRWHDCAGPLFASFAGNNLLPFRAGDVMRSFAFTDQLGTTSGVVLATVVFERLLDLLVLLAMLGTLLVTFGTNVMRVTGASSVAFLAIAAIVLFVLLGLKLVAPVARALSRFSVKFSPHRGRKISAEIDSSLVTLRDLSRGGRMLPLVAWSVIAWTAEGAAFWLTALAMPTLSHPLAGWLALPVAALATLVPSSPGYVGTLDYFTARAMTAQGNEVSEATAYAFLVHAVLWVPTTLSGVSYILWRQYKGAASSARNVIDRN